MADGQQEQATFQSPTTGKVQPVDQDQWEEAIGKGYKPVSHKVMYSTGGQRAMVPNEQMRDYMKQGYQTTKPTPSEVLPEKGIWQTAKEDIGRLFANPADQGPAIHALPSSAIRSNLEAMTHGDVMEQSRQGFIRRRNAGYGLPYSLAATTLEATEPVNVSGMEEAAAAGHPREVLGHALGGAIQVAAPEVAHQILPHVPGLYEGLREGREAKSLAKATKETRIAAPPSRHEIDYNAALEKSRPYLAEEQRQVPVKSVRDAHDAANAAIRNIEGKVASYVERLPDSRVNGQDILTAARERLRSPESPRTPEEIQAGMRELQRFGLDRGLTLQEADRLRFRFNQDINSEMGMTEADRASVRASNPRFAAKEAAAEALRDAVYRELEQNGVPSRQMRQDEGGLIQMRDAFRRNITRAEKENAPSAFRRLGVFGPVGLGFLGETIASRFGLPPGISAATGLGTAALYEFLRNRMTPNPTIARAFGRFGRSSEAPNFPELRQRRAETFGTPIQPPEPTEPPTKAGRGVNEPLTVQPEGMVMREQHGPLFGGEPVGGQIAPRENIFESRAGEEPEIERLRRAPTREEIGPTKEEIEGAQERKERAEAEKRVEEQGIAGGGKAERRAAAEAPARPEDTEAVETEVKSITAKEPKPKRAKAELPDIERLYSQEEIADAEGLINQEVGMMQAGEKPGRYFDESEQGDVRLRSRGAQFKGGDWRGVASGREMQPFLREHPDWSPAQLAKAMRNKDSSLYKRAVDAAAQWIRQENEAAAAAERAAIQGEAAQERERAIGEPILPGFGEAVAGQEQGAARVKGEELSRQMNEPRSIEAQAGRMEQLSPLFRGTEASPQREIFGQEITPPLEPQAAGETYWKGDRAEYTGKRNEIAGGRFYEIRLLEGHLKGQTKWTPKPPGQ